MQLALKPKLLMVILLLIWISQIQAEQNNADSDEVNIAHSVLINSKTQELSGIKTHVVQSDSYLNEIETVGKVVSIEPLLGLRSRFQIAQAELKAAESKLKQIRENLKRQQKLFHEGVIAKRSLQELTAQKAAEEAAVDSKKIQLIALRNEGDLNWGTTLTEWFLGMQSAKIKDLLTGKQRLIQVIVPVNKTLPDGLGVIFVNSYDKRELAIPSKLISKAPQVENNFQGESYFFLSNSGHFQTGMKITAWLPESNQVEKGVFVPESALIWYMDQLFVYVKIDKETFRRQDIKKHTRAGSGYLIEEGLKIGDEIVVSGAQMVLSEELRQQIPDED